MELCTAMPDYGQCPKSQQGIHKPEMFHYMSFLDVDHYQAVSGTRLWIGRPAAKKM